MLVPGGPVYLHAHVGLPRGNIFKSGILVSIQLWLQRSEVFTRLNVNGAVDEIVRDQNELVPPQDCFNSWLSTSTSDIKWKAAETAPTASPLGSANQTYNSGPGDRSGRRNKNSDKVAFRPNSARAGY
jgi:hypothetical protein